MITLKRKYVYEDERDLIELYKSGNIKYIIIHRKFYFDENI